MAAMEPFHRIMGIDTCLLSKQETYVLEADLFSSVCEELKNLFRDQYKNYFRILNFSSEQENSVLETDFIRLIIKDILSSEEYSLDGIAYYADTHTDIIQELYLGCNTNPSAKLLRKIIELHRSIRRDLYNMIMRKIATKYVAA